MSWAWRARDPELSLEQLDRARRLLESISERLAQKGYRVRPYEHPELPTLRENARGRQAEAILRSLEAYDESLASIETVGLRPREVTRQLLWRTLSKLGYTPKSDVMEYIEDDHVVEVYTWGNRQVFRNLLFFEFCSLTLEDIAGGDWRVLSERDQTFVQNALMGIKMIQAGVMNRTWDISEVLKKHRMTETRGEKRSFYIHGLYASPLRQAGQPMAYLIINRPSWE